VGLERGPLSLVSTNEELLGRKNSGSSLERREYGRRDPSRWPRGTIYRQKLALISPTSGRRSVNIVRSRTQATDFTSAADLFRTTAHSWDSCSIMLSRATVSFEGDCTQLARCASRKTTSPIRIIP
jgi:hypothetical protein